MTNVIRAELYRLVRRRTILIGGAVAVAFSFLAAFAIFAAADSVGPRSTQGGTTLAQLAAAGGGTEAFAVGASFASLLAFVSAIALIGNEFANGTFRSLALREPRRTRLIVGKFVGLSIVLAGMLLAAEALTFVTSLLAAQWQDVPTDAWFSTGAIGEAIADFASTFAGLAGWMVFGTFLAVVFRSVPIALGGRGGLGRAVREHHGRLVVDGVAGVPGPGVAVGHRRGHDRTRAEPSRSAGDRVRGGRRGHHPRRGRPPRHHVVTADPFGRTRFVRHRVSTR